MDPKDPKNPNSKMEEAAKVKFLQELDKEYTIKFKKRDWAYIYNIITSLSYKIEDAKKVILISEFIYRLADLKSLYEMNKPPVKPEEKGVITN